jgi:hypothetical protein
MHASTARREDATAAAVVKARWFTTAMTLTRRDGDDVVHAVLDHSLALGYERRVAVELHRGHTEHGGVKHIRLVVRLQDHWLAAVPCTTVLALPTHTPTRQSIAH